MTVTDNKVDQIARQMLIQHGPRAALTAVDRLNECIDRYDWIGRDTWARVVRRIHEYQHSELPG